MAKSRSKKARVAAKRTDAVDRLRKALMKRTKGELVEVIAELAQADRALLRQVEMRFHVEAGWCSKMLQADRVAFIYRDELQALRPQIDEP